MNIFLSWKLIVASILFLIDFSAELELPEPYLTDSSSSVARNGNPQPIKVSSIKYESARLNIYDSQQTTSLNKTIYFYSPIALLNHLSVTPINNETTTKGILRIRFSIWSKDVTGKVAQHLTQFLNQQIESDQVKVFPFDSARLISKVQSDDFSLTNEWITNNINLTSLRFDLICPTKEDCNRVKNEINNNPKKFQHLRLEFNNPTLNDDTCFNNGVGISQEDFSEQLKESLEEIKLHSMKELTKVKQELLANFEAKFANFEAKSAKELNDLREVVFQDLNTTMRSELIQTNADLTKRLNLAEKELESTKNSLAAATNELSSTKSDVDDLRTKLNEISRRLDYEIKDTKDNLKKQQRENLNLLETTTTNLASTRTELSSTKSSVADLTKKLNARTSEIIDIGQMPTSCSDLQRMGHKLSGFFSVKGSKKMEMVYCNFYSNQNNKQKWIGYADVKSAPVYFYVQQNSSSFNTISTPIPFHLAVVNEGNAMDLASGKFTAPRPGIYFFSFMGLAHFPASSSSNVYLAVGLYLNGGLIGDGYVEEANTLDSQNSPLTLQSTLNLKKEDQVWLQIDAVSSGTYLHDHSDWHHTHFTGFVLEEEIAASL